MIIYFDSYCKLCTKSSLFWKKADWFHHLKFSSFRDLDNYPEAMAETLHVYDRGQWFQGFQAIISVTKKLPALWVLVPFLYGVKWIGLGDYLYKKIARNRKLIPVRQCDQGTCGITYDGSDDKI
ncbi:thiol-disulfide oxidoreductase DCC family protein [Lentibacillus juripiscarius]|uniref:Thiol-disulfide oxidoreductase DCC family protein n=1 Tax=Lentibacillus juripiscarius TaxID=257446 RepID=A0ABW5V952_9BACI